MRALVIGDIDYSRKIEMGSLQFSYVDFDGENAETTRDLVNHRDFLGSLYKIQVKLTRITGEQMQQLMKDISVPDGFMVTFIDPAINSETTLKFQKTSIQGAYQKIENGKIFYESVAFTLNETK